MEKLKLKATLMATLQTKDADGFDPSTIYFCSWEESLKQLADGFVEEGYKFYTPTELYLDSFLKNRPRTAFYNKPVDYFEVFTGYPLIMTSYNEHPYPVTTIDLSEHAYRYFNRLKITGTYENGEKVTWPGTFSIGSKSISNGFTTVYLSGFENLIALKIDCEEGTWNLSVDRVEVVTTLDAEPEPSTWALLALGLTLICAMVRNERIASG